MMSEKDVESLLNEIESDSDITNRLYMDHMHGFVNDIKSLAKKGKKLTDKHVDIILSICKDRVRVDDIKDFVSALKEQDFKLNDNHVEKIFGMIYTTYRSSYSDVKKLANELKENNKDLYLISSNCKNIISNKCYNSGVVVYADYREFFCGLCKDALDQLKSNSSIGISDDYINLFTSNNNEHEFAKKTVSIIENRLSEFLDKYKGKQIDNKDFSRDLETEKRFCNILVSTLEVKGLININQQKEFERKIDNLSDLSNFITAIKWLACLLSIPLTLTLSLKNDKIRNVFLHPIKTRIFDRLQESRASLVSPLQKIASRQEINTKNDQQY